MSRSIILSLIVLIAGIQGCSNDVSQDARWRGGYARGQTLRLRTEAFCYRYQYPCDYPRKCGTQITIDPNADPQDPAISADWERLFEAKVVARLPEGTRLRVESVDYAATFNTTTLVPHAVILDGPQRGRSISLLGISTDIRAPGYPNPISPNQTIVDVVPDRASD
jgi:hypothetical protein